jgi:threonine synthase
VLELFHGPTCAFKDFGARFMARLFRTFLGSPRRPLTVLVATSGDTGSAVADAFFDPQPNPPIRVAILFPRGRVSLVQEKQMTTLGHNVTAFEVEGTFDDCQRLVKLALADYSLREETPLTSANSINIARLLPQLFYYAHAIRQLAQLTPAAPIISVPSGNLGNLTGALLAHLLEFRAAHFIAACNQNATFPEFLSHGNFSPHLALETLSNAMDVGNPSNFARIVALYKPHPERLRAEISGSSCSDSDTLHTMRTCFDSCGYLLDPHTAVGLYGLQQHRAQSADTESPGIVVATAHPAKFGAAVERAVGFAPEFPPQLERVISLPSHKIPLPTQYEALLPELRRIAAA